MWRRIWRQWHAWKLDVSYTYSHSFTSTIPLILTGAPHAGAAWMSPPNASALAARASIPIRLLAISHTRSRCRRSTRSTSSRFTLPTCALAPTVSGGPKTARRQESAIWIVRLVIPCPIRRREHMLRECDVRQAREILSIGKEWAVEPGGAGLEIGSSIPFML